MSDYRVTFKVTNARIKRAMAAAGFESVAELCRVSGLQDSSVGELINLKVPARKQNGEWRNLAIQLADVLNCMPEDLFSTQQQIAGLKKTVAERDFEEDAIQGFLESHSEPLMIPFDFVAHSEAVNKLEDFLGMLTPRERTVLELRYGLGGEREQMLDEICKKIGGVSKERVRQIEAKAIRKLKTRMGNDHADFSSFLSGQREPP